MTNKKTKPARPRAPSALLIVALCFGASAALRILDPDSAIAQAAVAAAEGAPVRPESGCSPVDPGGLLASLQERERQLEVRAAEIADRERMLQVADAQYEEQLAALREAEEKLASTLALADGAAERDVGRLVTVYENMKSKDAARIFETMDVTFAAGFLSRMRQDAAAKILGGMSSERAYAVSAVIAGRNASAPRE